MADTKITALTELAATPASNDMFPIVDVSDTSMAATGTNKKLAGARVVFQESGTATVTTLLTGQIKASAASVGSVVLAAPSTSVPVLDIFSGGASYVTIRSTDLVADATQKQSRFVNRHYTNSEEPVMYLMVTAGASGNELFYGGASSLFNAATRHSFYAAANNTTVTGTEIVKLTLGTALFNVPIYGSSSSGGTLTLSSTTHATKGKILLGAASAYDEANTRLGIRTLAPTYDLDVLSTTGTQSIARLGQASVSNGFTIASNGSSLTYAFENAKVGINETAPEYALHITGGTAVPYPIIKFENTNGKSWWLYAGALGANNFGLYDETGAAYRWVVDTNGNFALGNTTPLYRFDTLGVAGVTNIMRVGQTGVTNGFTVASDGSKLTYTFDPSVTILSGTVTCVDVVETSSREEKENFLPVTGVLGKIANIKAYRYNDKTDPADNKVSKIGLVAEEFDEHFPEVVAIVDIPDEDRKTKGLKYGRIVAIALQAVTELAQEVAALKLEVAILKEKKA